jgi:hypothetical protein
LLAYIPNWHNPSRFTIFTLTHSAAHQETDREPARLDAQVTDTAPTHVLAREIGQTETEIATGTGTVTGTETVTETVTVTNTAAAAEVVTEIVVTGEIDPGFHHQHYTAGGVSALPGNHGKSRSEDR